MENGPYYVMNASTAKFWRSGPEHWGEFSTALRFSSRQAALLDARPSTDPFVVVTVTLDAAGDLLSVNEAYA